MIYKIKDWGIKTKTLDSMSDLLYEVCREKWADSELSSIRTHLDNIANIVGRLIEHLNLDEAALSKIIGEPVEIVREPTHK